MPEAKKINRRRKDLCDVNAKLINDVPQSSAGFDKISSNFFA